MCRRSGALCGSAGGPSVGGPVPSQEGLAYRLALLELNSGETRNHGRPRPCVGYTSTPSPSPCCWNPANQAPRWARPEVIQGQGQRRGQRESRDRGEAACRSTPSASSRVDTARQEPRHCIREHSTPQQHIPVGTSQIDLRRLDGTSTAAQSS